jgi:pimeloyl-ACP methyl ester carboxylesterase
MGFIFTFLFLALSAPLPAHAISPYTATTNTVIDQGTGLEWQKGDDATPRTWSDGLAYCENLTLDAKTDWRLPNILELESIVDDSRVYPAIDPVFSCQSSYYWSATTFAGGPAFAWVVSFDGGSDGWGGKTGSYYVRCVRAGLSGALGSSGSFVFDSISAMVSPGVCFPVRVEARSASGVLDTTFSGEVSLRANYGDVTPMNLSFSNGVASNSCVKVYGEGLNKQLNASGAGLTGQSNYFSTSATTCSGKVLFYHDEPGVTVIIKDVYGVEVVRQVSEEDLQTHLIITHFNLPCGAYTVRAEKAGKFKDNIRMTVKADGIVETIKLPKGVNATPVVLIPGIMGSTHKGTWGTHPYFEGNYEDNDLEILLDSITGWNKLEKTLEDAGYNVVRCPWDWRGSSTESMAANVSKFLIPAINEALALDSSTSGKVHIVAHSMGGLLARAYIQSSLYHNEVEKLALVAVPHLGSANPYCLWEGGDFRTLKAIAPGDWSDDDDFYEGTVKKLWKETYKKKNWKSCNAPLMRQFLRDKAPSLQQLMFTDNFLNKNGGQYPVAVSGNVNVWLKELNSGSNYSGINMLVPPADVFSADGNGKVKTRVFLGNNANSTLRWIGVENYGVGALYADGKPKDAGALNCESKKDPTHSYVSNTAGDKTVPLESAQYPLTQGWADREVNTSLTAHGTIMKSFSEEIKGFLVGDRAGTSAFATLALAKVATAKELGGEAVNPVLAFSVIGDIRLLVTDSQGRKSGVEPGTGDVVNEIPEAQIVANDAVASVMIENPVAGQYSLTYFGTHDRDFSLTVTAFNAAGEGVEKSFTGYRPDGPQTMTVSYNPTTAEQILVQPAVLAPSEMETEPYTCGAGQCVRLKWKASANAGVSQYIVYRSLADEPFYTERARVANGVVSYDTGEVWDGADDAPVNGYAVAAIKVDTLESFFAEEKDEIAKPFPWTMFLPAITNKKVK